MQSTNNNLCAKCVYGARVQAMEQCGCPCIDLRDLEFYAALRGYGMAHERGSFLFMMAKETDQLHTSDRMRVIAENTIAASMVKAANTLNVCRRFIGRSDGEQDEWLLFSRKGVEV